MWEIFIFVNPIGNRCLKTEKTIIQFTQQHKINAHFKFVALNNVYAVDDYILRNHLDIHSIALRNQITQNIHQATLYYTAATFQGNRKGRNFLMLLQDEINLKHYKFSTELVRFVARKVGLDWPTLVQDKNSQLISSQCQLDRNKAAQFEINATPAIVIYDYSNHLYEQGVLIKSCSPPQLVSYLNKLVKQDYQILHNQQLHMLE